MNAGTAIVQTSVVDGEPSMHPTSGGSPRQLVGRQDERRRFLALLDSGRKGVVLHGPTGVGKTRLADELVALAEGTGRTTRTISGRGSTTDLPLAPFAPLMPIDFVWTEGVSLLVMARSEIDRLARGAPLILGVDDAHLLDPASCTLVHQLVATDSVQLVATVRDDEWVPQPIVELWRTGMVEQWAVDRLSDAELLEIASSILQSEMPMHVAEHFTRLCAGNPLYATTLARAIAERGTDSIDDLRSATTAPTIVDFVDAELHSLPPDSRDALSIVALAEPLGIELLHLVVDPAALIELERRHWIALTESGRRTEVRLTHPLFGEVLRHTMSRLLARSVYRDLAQAVRAFGARRHEDLLRVALWSLESGHTLPSAELVAAARQAARAGDVALAQRLSTAAWESDRDVDAGLLLLETGSTLGAERAHLIEGLEQRVDNAGQGAWLVATAATESFLADGDLTTALARLDTHLATLDDTRLRGQLLGQRAWLVAHGGDLSRAEQLIDEVTELVGGDVFPTAVAAVTIAGVRGVLDPRTVALIDRIELSAAVETPLGQLDPYAIHSGVSRLLIVDGQLARAETWARRAVEQAPKDRRLAFMPESYLGSVLAWRGRTHEALHWARRAAELQRTAGLVTAERWSRITMMLSAVYIGDLDEARRTEADLDRLPVGPSTTRAGDEWYARSVLAELAGELDLSLQWAVDGVVESRGRGALFDELMGWMSIAWLDVSHVDVDRVRELGPMTGGLGSSYADYAIGRATGSPELISRATDTLIAAGCDLIAVGFAVHASDAWATQGDERAAARWSRRATEIAAGLELVSVFAPVAATEPLSRREREVADLAVLGMSSREIGDRLFLSTRTVDNHLARAYGKLGVGGRAELVEALARA